MEPPNETPAFVATPVADDARTPVEAASGLEPDSARGPFSLRARIVIVAAVAVAGILLAVTVFRPSVTRSVFQTEDRGPVPHDAQTMSVDLARAQFQIGIVDGVGEKWRLVHSTNNVSERDVDSASLTQPDGTAVFIRFGISGASKMLNLTTANIGKQMGFVRDGNVLFHMVIDAPFSSYAQISFASSSEAKEFIMTLQGGRN